MNNSDDFEIFLVGLPGLESVLGQEARERGFAKVETVAGGATCRGGWPEVWRANLEMRGASRVLVRIAEFRAPHLAQLDKRSRKVDWAEFLPTNVPISVEASSKRSRVYHTGAIRQRIEGAITDKLGVKISPSAPICLRVRLDDDLCTISIDTSGDPLHKREHKLAVNKAPMRETMAAQFLLACGYKPGEPLVDPMCGSGTFVIEAAEMTLGLQAGRSRSFAFEHLPSFSAPAFAKLKASKTPEGPEGLHFCGSDRDKGAIEMSQANAGRAGVDNLVRFDHWAISDLQRPSPDATGLVIVNPPYGDRIGDKKGLAALYGAFGKVMKERFVGWRVGLITDDHQLAKATGLRFKKPTSPIPHGGLKVKLYQTGPIKTPVQKG